MHALYLFVCLAFHSICQVSPQSVGIERSDGRHQFGYGLQTGVECLVGALLVGTHGIAPEAFLAQSDKPVAHLVHGECLYQSACLGRFVLLIALLDLLDEAVEAGQQPAVHFGSFVQGNLFLFVMPSIHIGIHGQEAIRLCQLAEEGAGNLLHTFDVKLQVVPRSAVGNHIPSQWVGTELLYGTEGIHGIAKPLGHLHSILVQHQSVAYHSAIGHAVKYHGAQSMQGVKPSSCLVHTFCDEVGREGIPLVYGITVLEGVVYLSIGHGTAVEPYVYQVGLSLQYASFASHQDYVVHHGAMQVYAVIVLLTHVSRHESLLLQWVALHDTSSHTLLYLSIEFLQ